MRLKRNIPNLRFKEFSGEWEEKRLGEIGESFIGLTYKPTDIVAKDGIIVFRSSNIQNGVIDYKDIVRVDRKVKEKLITKKDDLLVCARNGSTRLIGKNALLKEVDSNQTFGAFMMVFRSDKNRFVHQLLNTKRYMSQISENLGARINQITSADLSSFKFFFPQNYEEIQKIASFLDLLDERIATQNKIIEELKQLKNGISLNLFTNRIIFDKQITLSKCGTLRNGYAFKSSTYNLKGKYSIITIANVTGSRFIESVDCNKVTQIPEDIQSHQILSNGDILISLTGNVGRVSLCTDGHFLLNQRVGLFELSDSIDKEFIYQVLSSKHFENEMIAKGQGAAQMNINKNDVESYVIPYSTNLQNIRIVSSLLKSLDEKILTMEHLLLSYNKQKTYLLRQMFI